MVYLNSFSSFFTDWSSFLALEESQGQSSKDKAQIRRIIWPNKSNASFAGRMRRMRRKRAVNSLCILACAGKMLLVIFLIYFGVISISSFLLCYPYEFFVNLSLKCCSYFLRSLYSCVVIVFNSIFLLKSFSSFSFSITLEISVVEGVSFVWKRKA